MHGQKAKHTTTLPGSRRKRQMITQFGSLYAGHVDLENIGLDGTPVNERWLSDEHLATVFEKAEVIATCMDRLGYDTLWAAEHRFQRDWCAVWQG